MTKHYVENPQGKCFPIGSSNLITIDSRDQANTSVTASPLPLSTHLFTIHCHCHTEGTGIWPAWLARPHDPTHLLHGLLIQFGTGFHTGERGLVIKVH